MPLFFLGAAGAAQHLTGLSRKGRIAASALRVGFFRGTRIGLSEIRISHALTLVDRRRAVGHNGSGDLRHGVCRAAGKDSEEIAA